MTNKNLRLAIRQLRKNSTYTYINVLGLAIGVAASLLLFRIVQYEWSFNRQFPESGRIARIVTQETDPSNDFTSSACIPIPAMQAMEQSVPQFEQFARVREIWPTLAVPDASGGLSQKKFAVSGNGS